MLDAHHFISTPENVDLRFELAGLGNRVAACFIDTVISYILVGLVWTLVFLISWAPYIVLVPMMKAILVVILQVIGIFASFLIIFGYFIFFEWLWSGQTPGKNLPVLE